MCAQQRMVSIHRPLGYGPSRLPPLCGQTPQMGLEPTIPGLGGQCLIHQATGADVGQIVPTDTAYLMHPGVDWMQSNYLFKVLLVGQTRFFRVDTIRFHFFSLSSSYLLKKKSTLVCTTLQTTSFLLSSTWPCVGSQDESMLSRGWFRSIDLWVMGPARFRCATLLCNSFCWTQTHKPWLRSPVPFRLGHWD